MALKIAVVPADEPVTVAEAKEHCRVDVTTDDATIQGFIETAREVVEVAMRQALVTQTWDLYLDSFPGTDYLELPLPPLQSVTYVKYTTKAGVLTTFDSASYMVDTYSQPGRIRLKDTYSWPSDELQIVNGVNVRFVCGYGATAGDVPQRYRLAIMLLAAHWYENREAIATSGAVPKELPLGVESLLWIERVKGF